MAAAMVPTLYVPIDSGWIVSATSIARTLAAVEVAGVVLASR